MTLDEFAELFPVFVPHVNEFHAAPVWADIADHGGEIDLAKSGADLQLDGVADTEFPWGFLIGAAQTDRLYTSKARWCALDVRTKRRLKGNSNVPARVDIAGTRLCRGSKRRQRLLKRRTILDQCQRISRCGAQTRRFRVSEALTSLRQVAKKLGGFRGVHAAERFDGFNAHKLVTQRFMFTGSDFHQLWHGGGFLRQAELVNHHGNDHGMSVSEDGGEYESGAYRRCGIVWAHEFADRQILKVPFPTCHGASASPRPSSSWLR